MSNRLAWAVLRRLHRADFRWLLPAMARLPLPLGLRLAHLRGRFNALVGRDWRSMALGFRHIRAQSAAAYRLLPSSPPESAVQAWSSGRFVTEARDEYEARLVAAGRVGELECEIVPADAWARLASRGDGRGLVLLTPHFESFFLGVAFLARQGIKVNLMSSSVTHDSRVDPAVQAHFTAKYRGLEPYLNGGKVVDLELGARQFYRMLQNGECLVILGDAPVLPDGVAMEVEFLGGLRSLSGGPLRMARSTGSDIGGYVCRHLGDGRYSLELAPVGPASDDAAVSAVYRFFSDAIMASPAGWWGSDLLPNIPLVAPVQALPAYSVLALADSPLEGSDELALGKRLLRSQLSAAGSWLETSASAAMPPDVVLGACNTPHLLVLLAPHLITTTTLATELAAALTAAKAACAVSPDQRDASGEWAIGYTTQADVEHYVARRQALPQYSPFAPAGTPLAYVLDVQRARDLLRGQPDVSWQALPLALRERTVLAERAFVHSYGDYQQGARPEMLELLPTSVTRLLDVGGGEGLFARSFAERRGGQAWLVEPSDAALRAPASDNLRVFHGRLEQLAVADTGLFDAVSFLDVLEHIPEPLKALQDARRFLRPQGLLLVSVPNVGHWSVVRDLARGRFDYLPVGVLCGTHLRFFTRSSLEQLLAQAGFKALRWHQAGQPMPEEFEQFLRTGAAAGLNWDRQSLEAESLHVLATLD
ncbi:MAG: methyltransferase domain-containing protein [Burkholderiales bacterium]|nr:methyltransferase domain-containing protein [Burkholderiales bacterium]